MKSPKAKAFDLDFFPGKPLRPWRRRRQKKKPGVAGLSRTAMRGNPAQPGSTLDRLLVPTLDLVPVDHVVERADVVRTTVLVLQVVGVFPHVQAEDRGVARADALHERAVLVGAALDRELEIGRANV